MTFPLQAGYRTVDAIVFNPLWMPGEHPIFQEYIIAGGQSLAAGSVLGLISASGKLVLSALAAGDGSQTPMAILPQPINTYASDGATPQDMWFSVLVHGRVNPTALVFGTGQTIANTKELLRANAIHLVAPIYSGG